MVGGQKGTKEKIMNPITECNTTCLSDVQSSPAQVPSLENSVPETASLMVIKPNHRTFVRIEKPLSAVPKDVGLLFQAFHQKLSRWNDDAHASLECEAHARGVTYLVDRGSRAFVWINFTAKGISLSIPGIRAEDFPGAKTTTNTPGGRLGILLCVAPGQPLDEAIQAVQAAFRVCGA